MRNITRFYTPGHKIERYGETGGGFGGPSQVWNTHLEIDGCLRPLSGDTRISADKETLFATHRFYCDVADIKETDRYVDPDGEVYRIKFVADVMNMGNHLQIDLEKGHE